MWDYEEKYFSATNYSHKKEFYLNPKNRGSDLFLPLID
jgi:hypothetical protein